MVRRTCVRRSKRKPRCLQRVGEAAARKRARSAQIQKIISSVMANRPQRRVQPGRAAKTRTVNQSGRRVRRGSVFTTVGNAFGKAKSAYDWARRNQVLDRTLAVADAVNQNTFNNAIANQAIKTASNVGKFAGLSRRAGSLRANLLLAN